MAFRFRSGPSRQTRERGGAARAARGFVLFFALLALPACDGKGSDGQAEVQPLDPAIRVQLNRAKERRSATLFVSGHSLVDLPFPQLLAQIARQQGTPIEWNRQYVVGSTIETRVRGTTSSNEWSGYRQGLNREGEGLDVFAEFKAPRTVPSELYDVLLITEQHGLLEPMDWAQTVKYLRYFHDRFIEHSPQGTTFFYESWLTLTDKSAPEAWIAYEKMATSVWQCAVTRVNVSLQAEGRQDRIISLPAATALAHLIEKVARAEPLTGITRGTIRETVDSLVRDDVHLTPLGAYYVALVAYMAIFQRPVEIGETADVTLEQARTLGAVAHEFVSKYYAAYSPWTMEQCRSFVRERAVNEFYSYAYQLDAQKGKGGFVPRLRSLRNQFTWKLNLSRDDFRNPFYFDAAKDEEYWFKPR